MKLSRIRQTDQSSHWVKMAQTGHKNPIKKGWRYHSPPCISIGSQMAEAQGPMAEAQAQWLKLRARIRLTAPPARQRAERRWCEMTSVRSLRFTISSPSIISAGGQVPRGKGVMATSQGLLSKAHYGPLYLLNHARDGVRCGA